jgi:hypothetical protein
MTHAQSDDFDIAKGIFDQLKDLPAERQQRVLRWIAEGLGITPTASPPSAPQETSTPAGAQFTPLAGGTGSKDIKTFIAEKSPKSDQQFAAAVAYFYHFEAPPAERRDSVNAELLQEAARLAGRKRPASPRMTLNNAKAAGYLDSSSRGEFTINSVGENLVAMTLPGGAEAPSKKKRPAKKRAKGNSAAKRR